MHRPNLKHIESVGYATSVHRMGEYCELHAKPIPAGEPVYLSWNGDRDADFYVPEAASALAAAGLLLRLPRARELGPPQSDAVRFPSYRAACPFSRFRMSRRETYRYKTSSANSRTSNAQARQKIAFTRTWL